MRRFPIITAIVALCCATASGAPVTLRVRVAGAPPEAALPQGTVVEIERQHSGTTELQAYEVPAGGAVEVEVKAASVWYATPRAAGFWGEERVIVPSPSPGSVDLYLWPAAVLRGRLPAKSGVKDLAVQFQSARDEHERGNSLDVPRGTTECEIDGGRITCPLPAGIVDYSLRSTGHIPVYKWNQRVSPGQVIDLGALDMRKGLSLLGRAVFPPGGNRKDTPVRVTLEPDVAAAERPGDDARLALRVMSVFTDARGNFFFEGLQPGGYFISATAQDALTERREVVILEGVQAELREPLILTPPAALSIALQPRLDPWRKPWIVEVARLDAHGHRDTLVANSAAHADGTWTRKGLPFGDYLVKIRREPQGVWHSDMVSVSSDTELEITVPLQRVAGELKLGDDPLDGSLWFGGSFGEVSVPVKTKADGTFRAVLPQVAGNTWAAVDVVADRPSVRRTLNDVRLTGPDDQGVMTARIELPANRLYGEVTAKDGKVVSRAMVFVAPSATADPLQLGVDDAGVFSFSGLADGTYSVHASGPEGKSETRSVVIDDNSEEFVKLVLVDDPVLEGLVSSASGAVAGAELFIYPEDRTGFGLLKRARTDPEGRFRIVAPRHTPRATMTIAAPGYPFTLTDVAVDPARPLSIHLSQSGGRLVFEAAQPGTLQDAFLFTGGAFIALRVLHNAGIASISDNAATIDSMAAGQYQVCITSTPEAPLFAKAVRDGSRCVGGFLPSGGELTLRQKKH